MAVPRLLQDGGMRSMRNRRCFFEPLPKAPRPPLRLCEQVFFASTLHSRRCVRRSVRRQPGTFPSIMEGSPERPRCCRNHFQRHRTETHRQAGNRRQASHVRCCCTLLDSIVGVSHGRGERLPHSQRWPVRPAGSPGVPVTPLHWVGLHPWVASVVL